MQAASEGALAKNLPTMLCGRSFFWCHFVASDLLNWNNDRKKPANPLRPVAIQFVAIL